jgi:hypothetical protein
MNNDRRGGSGGFRSGGSGGSRGGSGGYRSGGSGGSRGGSGGFRPSGPRECIKQPALTVDRKPKCHSCHPVTDLYTAGNATRSTDHQERY